MNICHGGCSGHGHLRSGVRGRVGHGQRLHGRGLVRAHLAGWYRARCPRPHGGRLAFLRGGRGGAFTLGTIFRFVAVFVCVWRNSNLYWVTLDAPILSESLRVRARVSVCVCAPSDWIFKRVCSSHSDMLLGTSMTKSQKAVKAMPGGSHFKNHYFVQNNLIPIMLALRPNGLWFSFNWTI